jgi:putative lipoprotein (rSAM/lipoprotein system)
MKVRFNRWYNAVLTALLTMLGYGCSSTEENMDMYGTIVEYGCPYADYVVKGSVTDEVGNPIQGIKITAPNGSDLDSQFNQIVQTDAKGNFTLKEFSSMRGHDMIVEDIDGEANGGEFLSDTILVETLPMTQTEKGKGWYGGKFDVKADIKLKKK